MKVEIVTNRDGEVAVVEYDYQSRSVDEKPMVLDVLLQAQLNGHADLAFRYGCRARNCGVCTVDINGRPRLACRAIPSRFTTRSARTGRVAMALMRSPSRMRARQASLGRPLISTVQTPQFRARQP